MVETVELEGDNMFLLGLLCGPCWVCGNVR